MGEYPMVFIGYSVSRSQGKPDISLSINGLGLKVGASCGALVTKVLQAPEIPPNIRPLATQRGAAKQT
jgi:hypothetical protein